jgi:HD-GYP domain-containing protein (c-di-GMP phosphodiesterase class II)
MDATAVAALLADNAGTHFHPVLARNFLRILVELQTEVSSVERREPEVVRTSRHISET